MSFQESNTHKNLIETKEIVFPELVNQSERKKKRKKKDKKIKFSLQVLSHHIEPKKRS